MIRILVGVDAANTLSLLALLTPLLSLTSLYKDMSYAASFLLQSNILLFYNC